MHATTAPRAAVAAATLAIAALVAAGCGSSRDDTSTSSSKSASGPNAGAQLALVAYSTPKEAYAKLIPAFQKTDDGAGVQLTESYGASGDQSRAVDGGLTADVVEFSLQPDIQRLVDDKKVDADWNAGAYKGMVTDSVVVLAVRKGNPKHIQDWDDLIEKDVEVITPNPFTSGGARWNLMAAYGGWIHDGKSPDEALANLKQLLENTPVQAASGREATQTFEGGKGDVLISYENEALTAQAAKDDIDIVYPKSTLLIENPAAVLNSSKHPEAAKAFLDYLTTDDAQKIWADAHYRPVVKSVFDAADFHEIEDQFTIEEFGGWDKVMDEFFDRDTGSVADIEKSLGVATDG